MEQLVSRLDMGMFNAILRESAEDMPTDPVSDPISDSKVLPIPSGKSSFGAGVQLKNTVSNELVVLRTSYLYKTLQCRIIFILFLCNMSIFLLIISFTGIFLFLAVWNLYSYNQNSAFKLSYPLHGNLTFNDFLIMISYGMF